MLPEQLLLLSDLDGTLFDPSGSVSPENEAAVRSFIDAGGLFAIATGREPRNALRCIGGLPQNAPAIVLNGCGVYDYAAGKYLFRRFLDGERVRPFLYRMLTELPEAELQVYTEDGICYCTPREAAHPQLLAIHEPCIFTDLDALGDTPFFKCFIYVPPETDAAMVRLLREGEAGGAFRYVPGTTDVGGVITYHEMLPSEVSKGACVDWMRSLPALRGRTILAAGDYWNDLELLQSADISVAPANAAEGIRAICGYTGVTNSEHLIAWIVRTFCGIGASVS